MSINKFTKQFLVVAAALLIVSASFTRALADDVFTVSGFPVTLENYDMKSQDGALKFRGKGSIDLSSALGPGVIVSSEEVTVDSSGNGVFKNVTSPAGISAGGFTGRIASGNISFNVDSEDPISVAVTLDVTVAGVTTQVAAVLPVTSTGILNTKIALKPSQGDSFLNKQAGAAEIKVGTGEMKVVSGSFQDPQFEGGLRFFGTDLTARDLSVKDGITGKSVGRFSVGNFEVSMPKGMDFSYTDMEGFKAKIPGATIDISKTLPGAKGVTVPDLKFENEVLSGTSETQQTIDIEGAKLTMAKITFASEGGASFPVVKAKVDGSVDLGNSGNGIAFSGMEMDSEGNVSGSIKLDQPKTVTVLGMSQTVESIDFAKKGDRLSAAVSGTMAIGDINVKFSDFGVSGGKLNGKFDVSESNPLSFSWMPYMKLTSFSIENDNLKFSGQVDIPSPFQYSLKFNDVEIGSDGKIAGNVASSSRAEAEKLWKQSFSPALVTLENASSDALTVAGFSFRLDAVTIPNPVYVMKGGAVPATLVKLFMRSEISGVGDEKMEVRVDGLEFTKSGLKDTAISLPPPAGQDSLYSKDIGGWAKIEIGNAMLKIKGGKLDYFGTSGVQLSIPSFNLQLDLGRLNVASDGSVSAKVALMQAVNIDYAGFGIKLTDISVDWQQGGTPDIVAAGDISVGGFKVGFKTLKFIENDISLDLDASDSKPLTLSWFPFLKLTAFNVSDNTVTMSGRIETPEPFKYVFKFSDLQIDKDGGIIGASSGGNPWDDDSGAGLWTLENENTEPITVAGFSFNIKAISLPNLFATERKGSYPDTVLKLYMNADITLLEKKIAVDMNGIEIAKSGFKNASIDISPADGEESFFSQEFGDFASVSLTSVNLEIKDGSFDTFTFSGSLTLDVPELDAKISYITVDADRNVSGEALFENSPLELAVCGIGLKIDKIDFSFAGADDVSVSMAGSLHFGEQSLKISKLTVDNAGVSVDFGVSEDNPFEISWFPFIKVTQFEISESKLLFGGSIETPDPVAYTFAFQDITFDSDGEIVKAAKEGAKNAWDKATEDDLLTIVNTNEDPLTIVGFSFYIDAITIPNPMAAVKSKSLPDTLLKLYMKCEFSLGSNDIVVQVDGLEVTKDGLKDLTVDVKPAGDGDKLFAATFADWALFRVDAAKLVVEGGEFKEFSFSGMVTFDGNGFKIKTLAMSDSGVSGTLLPAGDGKISFGGITLALGGEIEFGFSGGSAGGGGPPSGKEVANAPKAASSSFFIKIKDLTIDFSGPFGDPSAKITLAELTYDNGDISAKIDKKVSFTFVGISFDINSFTLASKKSAGSGGRSLAVGFDGSLGMLDGKIKLDFKDFLISSSGEISGKISLAVAQSFDLYFMSFKIDSISIVKKKSSPLDITLAGSFKISNGTPIDFDSLNYKDGKFSFSLVRTEAEAIALPLCDFVKITKFQVKDSTLTVSGFMDIPLLGFRLTAEDITVSTGGTVTGGVFKMASSVTVDLGALKVSITSASFDLSTKYLKYSGSISLPSDIFSGTFTFEDMGIQMASTKSVVQDTSKSKVKSPSGAEDKRHGLPLKITNTNIGFKNSKVVLTLTGSINFLNKFTLNFENFAIMVNPSNKSDVSFSIGKVTGAITLASFKIEITDFQVKDDASDPFVMISGGMSIPQFGSVKVEKLEIHKSGKIALEKVYLKVKKSGYDLEATIGYKDSSFTGAGSVVFGGGKKLDVAVLFSDKEFKFYVSVSGLKINLFAGVILDGIGGGVHCVYDPFWMQFKITADLVLGDGNALKAKIGLTIDTSGVITLTGKLILGGSMELGDATIIADVPQRIIQGTVNVNTTLSGVVRVTANLSFYFSSSTWYVKGQGSASVASFQLGTVNLNISSGGFYLSGSFSFKSGIISASLSFSFSFSSPTNFSVSVSGSGKVDLWVLTVSFSIKLNGSYSGGVLKASVSVSGCVDCWLFDVCKSATVNLTISSSGVSISRD